MFHQRNRLKPFRRSGAGRNPAHAAAAWRGAKLRGTIVVQPGFQLALERQHGYSWEPIYFEMSNL